MADIVYYGGVLLHVKNRRRVAPYMTPARDEEQAVARALRWATAAFPDALVEGAGMSPVPKWRLPEGEPRRA